jgi:hypothetical protein
MRLGRRKGELFWVPDDLSAIAKPLGGPFADADAAFQWLLVEQEAKLTPAKRVIWAALHDAARLWWVKHPLPGSRGAESDVLAALLTILNGLRRGSSVELLCRLAAGAEWRAVLDRIQAPRLEGVA